MQDAFQPLYRITPATLFLLGLGGCPERFQPSETPPTAGGDAESLGTGTESLGTGMPDDSAVDASGDSGSDPSDGSETGTDDGTTAECINHHATTHGVAESHLQVLGPESFFQLTNTHLTVELWVRMDPNVPTHGGAGLGNHRHDGDRGGWFFSAYRDGTLRAQVVAEPSGGFDHLATATQTLADDKWHHLAWCYDQMNSRIFVDGVLVGEEPRSNSIGETATNLSVGISPVYQNAYAGDLDDVHISATVRYTQSFTPPVDAVADAATVGLWRFDEGAGNASHSTVDGTPMFFEEASWGVDDRTCR